MMQRGAYIIRISCVFVVLLISFGFLMHHLYELQIKNHRSLYTKAKSTYTASKTYTGKRGGIYDRNGNPLTGNLECKDILADLSKMPKDLSHRTHIVQLLAKILEVDPFVLHDRFNSHAVEIVVKKQAERNLARRVKALHIQGIRFIDKPKRYYPKGSLLANVLGFTDYNNHGTFGIESSWNDKLSPKQFKQRYERDRKGRIIKPLSSETDQSVNGHSIYLTIDEPIQHFVEAELQRLVEEFTPQSAYAIMANPKTGAIMAMAQWPTFNPNNRSHMEPRLWRNRIISDVYDPGSTMKCIAIAGALDYGTVTPYTDIDCENGIWHYGNRPLHDAGHRYSQLSVTEIIQKSSNIGTAKIALRMGKKRLYQTLKRFGFGSKTGIKLEHESPGILRHPNRWDKLSITRFPIGQGISVTPLQIVQAYCALANQGKMMKLCLVDRITNANNEMVKVFKPQVKNYAIRSKAANEIVSAMSLVTEEGGTAMAASVEGYVVAGKTGTSQKLINGSYVDHGKYVSSFIGFVPANDPAFVLLVVVDEPSSGEYSGGTVAAPSFSRIANRTLRYLNIAPASNQYFHNEEYVQND